VIGRLTGVVVDQGDDGTAILDVAGVGYEVILPVGAVGRAHRDDQGRVTLHVHTHATREEAMILYAFASADDRLVFRTLISVPNVGPKTALGILGALSVEGLVSAIALKDVGRLTSISGVGKKTAERLVLELKDKLDHLSQRGAHLAKPGLPAAAPPLTGRGEQLRSALANMGFRPVEVDRALEAMRDRLSEGELADRIREALSLLRK
jgi:holliday junction DNA helicase RuvA